MQHKQSSHTSAALRQWITDQVSSRRPGHQLPHDRWLGQKFHLSPRTVATVMRACADEGLVERYRGKGTFVPGKPHAPNSPPTLDAASELEHHIAREILHGRLRPGQSLPAVRSLCHTLKTAPATVLAAYRRLVAGQLVTRVGRHYLVGSFAELVRTPDNARIEFFVEDRDELAGVYVDPMFAAPAFRRLEDIMTSAGFSISYHFYHEYASRVDTWMRTADIPFGVVWYMMDGVRRSRYAGLGRALGPHANRRMPRLLIDLLWGFLLDEAGPDTQVFSRNHVPTTIGRRLARSLIGSHAPAVILVTDNPTDTPANRFHVLDLLKHLGEIHRMSSGAISMKVALLGGNISPAAFARTIPDEFVKAPLGKYDLYTADWVERLVSFSPSIGKLMAAQAQAGTVYLFLHDHHAAQALAWCRRHGVAVPGARRILGLENNPAYYHLGISQCVPDWDAIGCVMAHALLGDAPVARSHLGFLQTEARMVRKGTY